MKKTLVIVAHPSLANGSVINKMWCKALKDLPQVTMHSLYEVYPNGKIDVAREQQLVEAHERIVFQFPLWWYGAPALLKYWLDEVLTDGWAYGVGGDKFSTKEIAAAVSCGGAEIDFCEGGSQRHPLGHYLDVFDGIASFTRCSYIGFHAVYDTYNPATVAAMSINSQDYIDFLRKA